MEIPADSVSTVGPNYAATPAMRNVSDSVSNVSDSTARSDGSNPARKTFASGGDQTEGCLVDIPHRHGLGTVSMKPIAEKRDVNIHNVPVL